MSTHPKEIDDLRDLSDMQLALLEAIWIMRWNEDKTGMMAVLTSEEAIQMSDDIITELDKAGYVIAKKTELNQTKDKEDETKL